jgi:hypothetical protein
VLAGAIGALLPRLGRFAVIASSPTHMHVLKLACLKSVGNMPQRPNPPSPLRTSCPSSLKPSREFVNCADIKITNSSKVNPNANNLPPWTDLAKGSLLSGTWGKIKPPVLHGRV